MNLFVYRRIYGFVHEAYVDGFRRHMDATFRASPNFPKPVLYFQRRSFTPLLEEPIQVEIVAVYRSEEDFVAMHEHPTMGLTKSFIKSSRISRTDNYATSTIEVETLTAGAVAAALGDADLVLALDYINLS